MKLDTTSDNNGAISGEKPTLSQILRLSLTTCLACHVWLSLPDAGFIPDQVGLWKICEINNLSFLAKFPAQRKHANNVCFSFPLDCSSVLTAFRGSQPEVWVDMRASSCKTPYITCKKLHEYHLFSRACAVSSRFPKGFLTPKQGWKTTCLYLSFMVWSLPPSLPSLCSTVFFLHCSSATLTLSLLLTHPGSSLFQSLLLVAIF